MKCVRRSTTHFVRKGTWNFLNTLWAVPSGHRLMSSASWVPERSSDSYLFKSTDVSYCWHLNLKAVDISRHKQHCGIVTFDSTHKSQDQENKFEMILWSIYHLFFRIRSVAINISRPSFSPRYFSTCLPYLSWPFICWFTLLLVDLLKILSMPIKSPLH